MNIEQVAKVCHDANKSHCETIGDITQLYWEQTSEQQRALVIEEIKIYLNPSKLPKEEQLRSYLFRVIVRMYIDFGIEIEQ